MKQLAILFLCCLLFTACSDDDKNQDPILVTNIVVSDADKVFEPGDAITITAQGFQENDRFLVDMRWPLDEPSGPIKEGSSITPPIIKAQTPQSITFLVPGHRPAATLKMLLMRGDKQMTLCQVSVVDGQAPKELQLYGITNSRSMNSHPRGIQHIDLATGTPTDVVQLAQGEDFSLVVNSLGNYTLCGLLKQDGKTSIGNFDLSMDYWKDSNSSFIPLTFFNVGNDILAIRRIDEKNLTIHSVNTSPLSRSASTPESPALLPIPDGFKPESLSRYKGTGVGSTILFAADNGNGTFSPVALDLHIANSAIHLFDPIQADALIPFWVSLPKEKANAEIKHVTVGAFALAKPEAAGGGTELRLWNSITNSLEEPFATFPNQVRSIAPHFSEDMKTQELYVLFDTQRGDGIIQVYDMIKKEWRSFPNFNFPYSEILFAK